MKLLRTAVGLVRLTGFVLSAWTTWWQVCWSFSGRSRRYRQGRWMQIMCGRALRILRCRIDFEGTIPDGGLVVANHLGYVDILAIGALMPAAFVAKSSVKSWPVFGSLATMGGTIFVNRNRRVGVVDPLAEMRAALQAGVPLVVFPEGTSSDGSTVLKFHSSLLAATEGNTCRATPVTIRYVGADGLPNVRLAYHGDDVFFPHLLRTLGNSETHVHLRFGVTASARNRKELASQLQQSIFNQLESIASAGSQRSSRISTSRVT